MLWAHKVLKFILLFRTISSIRNSFLFWCYLLGTWTVFPADAKTLDISAVTLKEIKVTAETNKGNNYLIRDYSQFFSCSNKPVHLNFTYYIPKKARHKIHFCSTCNKALCCKLKHLLRLCLNPTYFNALTCNATPVPHAKKLQGYLLKVTVLQNVYSHRAKLQWWTSSYSTVKDSKLSLLWALIYS